MDRIKKHKGFLQFLSNCDPKMLKIILKNATNDQKRFLVELVSNVLRGNIPLTKNQKLKLHKHKSKLRKVCEVCVQTKKNKIINLNSQKGKKAINQIGGALPFLLLPLLALAGKAAAAGAVSAGAGYATKKIIESAGG